MTGPTKMTAGAFLRTGTPWALAVFYPCTPYGLRTCQSASRRQVGLYRARFTDVQVHNVRD
jgi:hypothetical protein